MVGYKLNMIRDGGIYKVTYTKNGKQHKATIGSDKSITVMAARKIFQEVQELLEVDWDIELIKKMYTLNRDAKRCGYRGGIIKYHNEALEIIVKILFPEHYEDFVSDENYLSIKPKKEQLEILNIGCTGSGKTRFIISAVLSKEALKNFVPALTSLKETTACSIVYHINPKNFVFDECCDFILIVELKKREEIINSIKVLIIEAIYEFIVTIKENAKNIRDIGTLCEKCKDAVIKRLEINYDKTFGLGIRREVNSNLADDIKSLTKKALMRYYGNSRSIEKLELADENFILEQLRKDFENEQITISHEDISRMLENYSMNDMIDKIYSELESDLQKYNKDYGEDIKVGDTINYSGNTEENSTLIYLSHIFGNKSKQRKGDFYTIKPLVKSANFYLNTKKIKYDKEIILSDSIGLNQGQKDASRINEVVFNRVHEAIQIRKPDIVLYHTKLNNKDDFMLDVIKLLNAHAYGKSTYIVAGRLDEVLNAYINDKYIEKDDMKKYDIFSEVIEEINQLYIDSDVTVKTVVGDKYLICDKTNSIADDYEFASKYICENILNNVIKEVEVEEGLAVDENTDRLIDIDFMEIIQNNNVPGNVYQSYLSKIPSMIPLNYNQMRWNTLEKAVEELRWNRYGFDVLYPAFNIKNVIANELNREDIRFEFLNKFRDGAEEMKRRYLLEVTEVAQIVLVTEYRFFMQKLLDMRYDKNLRSNLSLTMTDDRKFNLQKLYQTCMENEGLRGEESIKIIFHITWIRILDFFKSKNKV